VRFDDLVDHWLVKEAGKRGKKWGRPGKPLQPIWQSNLDDRSRN
jgi:hypothetical protein